MDITQNKLSSFTYTRYQFNAKNELVEEYTEITNFNTTPWERVRTYPNGRTEFMNVSLDANRNTVLTPIN